MKMWNYNILSVLTLFLSATRSIGESQKASPPASDFIRHAVVQPVLLHGRTKREICTTRDENGAHHLEVTLKVIDDEEYFFDLRLNLDLITDNHVLSYQKNGKTVLYKPNKEDIDLCHYSGSVRGKPDSWVAVSTCHGIQGLMFDGERTRYIEPAEEGEINAVHYIYHHMDLMESHPRRYDRTRKIRSTSYYRYTVDEDEFRRPHQADKGPYYVELVLVADRSYFEAHKCKLYFVHTQMQIIANILNSIYSKLDIFIALAGVEVWNEYDRISLSVNSNITVVNFLEYRKRELIKTIPNDNAQLLTLKHFDDNVVGKALRGAICTPEFSGGIINSDTKSIGLLAMTVAHEMGHNFGMDHDYEYGDYCKCLGKQCIMWAYRTDSIPTGWSTCSLKLLKSFLSKGIGYCLRNKPRPLIDYPKCGNGVVDLGEQCDCGTMTVASTYNLCHACCDPSSCKLRANATCDNSACCHLSMCLRQKCNTSAAAIDGVANENSIYPSKCGGYSIYNPTVRKNDAVFYVMLLGTVPAILLIILFICCCMGSIVRKMMSNTYT